MSVFDFLIVLGFVVFSVYVGWRNRKAASRDLQEYFLAGRSLPGWKAGLSMAATQFAADTPLLVMGIMAVSGIFGLWQLWIYALAFLMMGFVLSASWRRAEVTTDAELTEIRYSGKAALFLRGFKAVYFGTIFNCVVLAWVFFAAAKIAEPFLLWNQWLPAGVFEPVMFCVKSLGLKITDCSFQDPQVWVLSANNFISLLAILLVTTFYSATGGLRGVVATDIGQIIVMLTATLVFTLIVVSHVGGFSALADKLHALYAAGGPDNIKSSQILAFTPDQAKGVSFSLLALFALQWLIQLNADGTGYLAQRTMACQDEKQAKIAALVFTGTQILIRSWLWLPLGVGLLILFPPDVSLTGEALRADREGTFVKGISELLPVGLKGLMLTGMLAALASTVDTHINWGASYWANDIYKRIICEAWLKKHPSGRSLVWVARMSNLFLIVIALFIMTRLSSINHAWQTSLLLGAGMGLVLILRWLWWRINAWAEITAVLASAVAAPFLILWVQDGALRLLLIAFISAAGVLCAVFLAGPESKEKLMAFYRKVHPIGFWKPIAVLAGEPSDQGPKKLCFSLAAAVLAGLSVFCLLVGIGSLLVGSPPPVIFPWPKTWITANIIVGLCLCPVWIRLGFKKHCP